MPRYFFNRIDDVGDPHQEGIELEDLDAARCEAVLFAADTLRDARFAVWQGGEFRVEVADQDGHLVFIVRVSIENGSDLLGKDSGRIIGG